MVLNEQNMQVTPIESWFDDYETIVMPSGKQVGLRAVDILHLISDEGDVPNVLLQQLKGQMEGEEQPAQPVPDNPQASMEDIQSYRRFLDKLVLACWVSPPVSQDPAKIEAREAIGLHMIPVPDKAALIAWCMGGKERVEATISFLKEQGADLASLQSGT